MLLADLSGADNQRPPRPRREVYAIGSDAAVRLVGLLELFEKGGAPQRAERPDRRHQAEMPPARSGGDPAARRADDEAGPEQERFGDFFDRLGLLADRDRHRGKPDRAAAEPLDQRFEDGAVEPIEAERVDLVDRQRGRGDRRELTAPSARTSA